MKEIADEEYGTWERDLGLNGDFDDDDEGVRVEVREEDAIIELCFLNSASFGQ